MQQRQPPNPAAAAAGGGVSDLLPSLSLFGWAAIVVSVHMTSPNKSQSRQLPRRERVNDGHLMLMLTDACVLLADSLLLGCSGGGGPTPSIQPTTGCKISLPSCCSPQPRTPPLAVVLLPIVPLAS